MVLLRNVDEMGAFPGDTYAPEVCTYECSRHVGGINVGVMVLAPRLDRFLSFQRFAANWSERLLAEAGTNESKHLTTKIVGSSEQSFLREWNDFALGAKLTAIAPERRGMNWTQRSFQTSRCYKSGAQATAANPAPRRALSAFSGSYWRGRAGSSANGGKAGGGVGLGEKRALTEPQKTCLT